MALKKEILQRIATLTKIKVEDLETAIKDEKEVDIAIDEKIATFSDDELKILKSNTYADGKKAGVEMNVDDVKKKMGLDFTGKTVESLVEAATKKALDDAKIEPNQKVKELTDKVTTLQKTVTDQEAKLTEKDAEVLGVKVTGELYKHIPDFGENGPALGKDDVIQLMRANGYEFKLENGAMVPYKDGKQIQDKLSNPLAAKDVVSGFMKEKKLITDELIPDGRGGGNKKPPATAGKLSELKKQFTDQGKSLMGEEFSAAVEKAALENKEFDMKG